MNSENINLTRWINVTNSTQYFQYSKSPGLWSLEIYDFMVSSVHQKDANVNVI